MPIIDSTYKPSFLFKNGFVSTVYSGLVRRVKLKQERERITLKDGDFLDLDWSFSKEKTNKLILCFHGLEGHGQRPYVTGVAKLFNKKNIDAICVNFRGCSGEDNLKYRSYHSGATDWILRTKLRQAFRFHCASDFGSNCATSLRDFGSFCASDFGSFCATSANPGVISVRFAPL